MSHLHTFPAIRIPLSDKFTPSEPFRMSPVSDSLGPSTLAPNDDMFAWLSPPPNHFDQSTPPDSPCISIGEDPLLFDLDMDSESDPVTPDALFSITDLMDVDGHGIGLHHHVDPDFDLSLSHREPPLKEAEPTVSTSFSQDVLSETQESLTSANRDTKTPTPRQRLPHSSSPNHAPIPLQLQPIDNFIFEPLSCPSLPQIEASVSEKGTSSSGKRTPKRSAVRRISVKAESPTASIAKTRGSPTSSSDRATSSSQGDVMKGVKAMHLSHRKRTRTAPVAEDATGKEGAKQGQKNGSESGQNRTAKVGMRFRRRGAERRTGKVSEDEKNVPVLDKCVKCSTLAKNTPMMRKGPDGCRSLCNACGLKWSRHGVF